MRAQILCVFFFKSRDVFLEWWRALKKPDCFDKNVTAVRPRALYSSRLSNYFSCWMESYVVILICEKYKRIKLALYSWHPFAVLWKLSLPCSWLWRFQDFRSNLSLIWTRKENVKSRSEIRYIIFVVGFPRKRNLSACNLYAKNENSRDQSCLQYMFYEICT